jgi:16S rRNA (guanine527-N7)-methyltransferase
MSGAAGSRIAELVRRYSLEREAERALATLAELLTGDPAAPTSVRDEAKVLEDHLADSLVALELPQVLSAGTIADLGAGAGVGGRPLAIARLEASVTLVEANRRKAAFIERAAAACGLRNVQVVNARAEAWREGLGRNDLVTARALAPLVVVAEYAAPLLRPGGALVVWRGARDAQAEAAGAIAAERLGLELQPPLPVQPYPAARQRHLHVMSKVRDTPPGFPRRPGIARKRPLGGARPDSRQ